ncbi:MAG: hypothetical protein M3R44_02290 [Candidatus Eremiobacteraeota bacterium]|nr:hypothetical protein [Candidatus Eremiobacteraeota bacterium]
MTAFEYLSVLFSIIMGLALANLLGASARLMHARERVKVYWPALVWAGLLFVITVQHWWAEFSLASVHSWSFAGFVIVLMTPVTLYLLCDLVLPHHTENGVIELPQ